MSVVFIKKIFRFFCLIITSVLFSSTILPAQDFISTEDAFQHKQNANQFNQRGYDRGASINVDGKLNVSNSNGNVMYSYPLSSRTIQGYPMNTTLNYCGSVGFTAIGDYLPRALIEDEDEADAYDNLYDRWEKFHLTRSAWIVGFNGFAVQVLGINKMYCINPYLSNPDYLQPEKTDSAKFSDNNFNWSIEGYDFCNRMQYLWLDTEQDVIKLLRDDGSVLELRNGNVPSKPIGPSTAFSRPELYTGHYYVNEPNAKGFGIVEYSNKYLQSANLFNYPDFVNFSDLRPRILHYYPGDGLEYVFYEWVTPFGKQHPSHSADLPMYEPLGRGLLDFPTQARTALLLGSRFGGYSAAPTIFYLHEVKDGAITLTSFKHSRHSSSPLINPTDNVDSTKGRASLIEFDGHTFKYSKKTLTVEALGRAITINYDSVTKDGYRKPTDDWGIPWEQHNTFEHAQNTARLSPFDFDQYRSYLGMVTSIEAPERRNTFFGYENYYRKYTDYRFPTGAAENEINLKNYRLTSIIEPAARYTIHYNSAVSTERSYNGTDSLHPSVQKNITNIVDEVRKFSREASLSDPDDYLTKTNYTFGLIEDIYALDGTSHVNIYDKITGLATVKTFNYKYHETSPLIMDEAGTWRTPILKHTYLAEFTESGAGITTITKTHEDSAFAGTGSRFLFLPKTQEVLVLNNATNDTVRKSYQRFGYSFSIARTYDSNASSTTTYVPAQFGKEVETDTIFVYAPDNISGSPLFYKTNTYLHLPYTHETIDIIDSVWLKYESMKRYTELLNSHDADVIGKSWEEVLCDPRVAAYRYDTLNNVSVAVPPHFRLPIKTSLYDNSTFLQGKATVFNTNYASSNKPLFSRGLAKSDTIIGKNGTLKIRSGIYDYSKVNRRGGGLLSMLKNANGAKQELFYDYNQPIDYSVSPGESCPGYTIPKAFKLDNTNDVDTSLLTDWLATSYIYEAPFAEQNKVRKYKIGIGDTARLDSTSISQVYERGYFGQILSSVNPNGWFSQYIYDFNGRIRQVHLPGDFSSMDTEDLTESFRNVKDNEGVSYTGISYYQDSVRCRISPKSRTYKTFRFVDKPEDDYSSLYASRDAPNHKPCPCGDPSDSSGIHIPEAQKGAKTLDIVDPCNVWIIQDFDVMHYATMLLNTEEINAPGNEFDSIVFRVHVTAVNSDFTNLKLSFPQLDTTIYFLLNAIDSLYGSVERKFLSVNLTSKLSELTQLSDDITDLIVNASTSTIGGRVDFANETSDTGPVLKLYGKFRTKLADFTLKYLYNDYYYPLYVTVLSKTDDGLHTSNSWAEDTYVRRSSATNIFGVDYQVKKTKVNIGTLSAYRTDSVISAYTGQGQSISVTDQEGNTVQTDYDALGRPVTVTNADSTEVSLNYDFGVPSDYSITDSTYYGFCSRKKTADEKGLGVVQYFDAFDRLRKEIIDSGGVGHLNLITKYEYDIQGRLKKVTNPQSQVTSYWYDDFGRVKYKHQPDMGVLSYGYDNVGNTRFSQTQEQSSGNKFTYYQYDDMNRVTVVGEAGITKTVYPDTTLTPGDDLNLHRWTDSLDATILHDNSNSAILTANKTLWKNLVFGVPAVATVVQPPNHPVFSACITEEPYYPESAAPVFPTLMQGVYGSTAVNPLSVTTSNFEDISTHPEFVRMAVQYDELPYKVGAVWGNFTPTSRDGVWDSLAPRGKVRNLRGQQSAVAYRDKASEPFHYQVYSYDERGRVEALLRFTSNLGYDAVYYEYNSANQIVRQTVADSWKQSVTWYGYDYNGRIDTIWTKISANGTGLLHGSNTASLDSLKRPYFISKPSGCQQIVYRYNKRGMVDTMLTPKPQLITKYAYNSRGFLDSLVCKQGNTNIFKERLSYDVDGQIVAQHWKQGTAAEDSLGYEYDNRKQLTKWINPQGSYEQYVYDNVGNRVTASRYDATNGETVNTGYYYELGKNRLTKRNVSTQDTTTNTYYKDGALKRSQFATYNGKFWNNKIENYGYGYNGLLTSYSLENTFSGNTNCFSEGGGFTWVWNYRYTPTGERESKRLVTTPLGNGVRSHNWNYYLLGGNKQQLAVYNGRETTKGDCFSSGQRVYFYPSEYLTYGFGSSALLTTRANGYQEYKVVDHLGSTRAVLDSTGNVSSSYDYEPFGEILAQTGVDSRKSFIDKEKDYESGLGDFGVRKFDGDRFTSIDPLWEKYISWNPYQYSANNPLRLSDPTGKDYNITGNQAQKALDAINNRFGATFTFDPTNTSLVRMDPDFTPQTAEQSEFVNMVQSTTVTVNLIASDATSFRDQAGANTSILVGGFNGSTVDANGHVTATQYINMTHVNALETTIAPGSSGENVVHETLEAYLGAKVNPGGTYTSAWANAHSSTMQLMGTTLNLGPFSGTTGNIEYFGLGISGTFNGVILLGRNVITGQLINNPNPRTQILEQRVR